MKYRFKNQERKALAIMAGAFLFVSSLCAWYIFSTKMAAAALVDDIIAGDVAGIMEKVDMKSLRKDARGEVTAALKENFSETGDVSFNHNQLTEILVGKLIDETYSEKGAERVIADKRTPYSSEAVEYKITHKGMNRFDVRVEHPIRVELIFYRHGFRWKLSAIRNLNEPPVKNYASNEAPSPSL